jgi:hypothetical protein
LEKVEHRDQVAKDEARHQHGSLLAAPVVCLVMLLRTVKKSARAGTEAARTIVKIVSTLKAIPRMVTSVGLGVRIETTLLPVSSV